MASNRETKLDQTESIEEQFDRKFNKFSNEVIKEIQDNIDNPNISSFIKKAFTAGEYGLIISELIESNILEAVKLGYGGGIEFIDAQSLTKKLFKKSWVPDKINISKRILRANKRVQKSVTKDITEMIRVGNARKKIIKSIKKRIDKGQIGSDPLRKDVLELVKKTELTRADQIRINRIRGGLENKTELQRAYSKILDAVESKDKQLINKTIKEAIDTKARYVAERISRTEVNRAWTEGFHLKHKDDEDVDGYRWKLSSGHREIFDQCDVYANSDFGMGKGVFPRGKIPPQPAHPNCRCYLVPIYNDSKEENFSLKKANGRIKRLPEHQKSLLMGEKNRKLYNDGKISYMSAVRGFEKPQPIKTRIVEKDFE